MITILPATAVDGPAIAALEAECFSEPWSQGAIETSMAADHTCFLVARAEESGRVVGYVSMMVVCDVGEILNLAVTATHRRLGIGRELLASLERVAAMGELSELQLEVRASNAPAIALYTAMGYEQVGRRKNFYRKPTEDAILMNRLLGKPRDGAGE